MWDVAWEFVPVTRSPGNSNMHSGLGSSTLGLPYSNYLLFLTTPSTPSLILSFRQQIYSNFPGLCSNQVMIIFTSGLLSWKNSLCIESTFSTLNFSISCNLSFLHSTETASVSTKFNGLFSGFLFLFSFSIIQWYYPLLPSWNSILIRLCTTLESWFCNSYCLNYLFCSQPIILGIFLISCILAFLSNLITSNITSIYVISKSRCFVWFFGPAFLTTHYKSPCTLVMSNRNIR